MRPESNVTGKNTSNDAMIDSFNKLLRGELSAVETYGQALERLRDSAFVAELAECRRSHEERVELLRQQVIRLGGKPSDSSGPWGGFAKLVEGSAKLFGEKSALAALEEGEDHGLRLYRDEIGKLDVVTRDIVERSLLPAQERTHGVLSALKHTFH
jgi:hypothetical protein